MLKSIGFRELGLTRYEFFRCDSCGTDYLCIDGQIRCNGKGITECLCREDLYYPCVEDPNTGHISKRVAGLMSLEDARDFLKKHYWEKWLRLEAIPQPQNHHYFK